MNAEDYAKNHPNYWNRDSLNAEIKLLLDNAIFNRLIDIGCGNGSLLYALKEEGYLHKFDEVWAVDLSSKRLSYVRKISETIKTVKDDAQNLIHIPDNYFDLVISTQVIEHVMSDRAMLKSLYRICKNGGTIYLDTVFKKRYAWYFYKNQYGKWALDPTHEREYMSEDELFPKINEAGLRIIRSKKTLQMFPLLDFFMRQVKVKDASMSGNRLYGALRKVKVPIIGYYTWKMILAKS